jgi:hypothetical protein
MFENLSISYDNDPLYDFWFYVIIVYMAIVRWVVKRIYNIIVIVGQINKTYFENKVVQERNMSNEKTPVT